MTFKSTQENDDDDDDDYDDDDDDDGENNGDLQCMVQHLFGDRYDNTTHLIPQPPPLISSVHPPFLPPYEYPSLAPPRLRLCSFHLRTVGLI